MNPTNRLQQIEDLFHAAMEHKPAERTAFLATACAGDAELQVQVEALIAAHEQPGSALAKPVQQIAAQLLAVAPGQMLSHYRLISLLGRGGMGEVYLAEDLRLGRQVALKLLPAEFTKDQELLRRFAQEAKAASALNHPNIITIHEVGEERGTHFIAAEYVDGQSLRQRLQQEKPTLAQALDIAIQTATALNAAHEAKIIHRDIKPDNLMLRHDGIVKVLDFGLAKLTEGRNPEVDTEAATLAKVTTDPGTVLGTPQYMSPEQARGWKLDARTDIFSLGVVLYEMIAGRAPFEGGNVLEVVSEILKTEPAPLRSYAPDVSRELEHIIAKALRKDREARYQTVKDLLIDLKDLKQDLEYEARQARAGHAQAESAPATGAQAAPQTAPNEAARTTSSAEVILSEIKRHKVGVGISLAIFLAALAGLAFGAYKLIGSKSAPNQTAGPAPRVVPFTSYPGNECCPSFSPDGNQLAFVWRGEKGDNNDIYVKLIDAGSPLKLTTHPDTDTLPAWSPDGRYLAFVRFAKDEQGIFLVPALGGAERLLYSVNAKNAGITDRISWSPDGKLLAFSESGSPQESVRISLLSVESQEKRQLTPPPVGNSGDFDPAFSPDGKMLAFIRVKGAGPQGEIYLVPAAGGAPRRLTANNLNASSFAWTPDGRELIYASNDTGLRRIPITGGTPVQVPVIGGDVASPVISRQGNRLAFVEYQSDVNIWRFETNGQANRKVAPVKLVFSTKQESSPQYSADGQRIVFASDRSGSTEIWVCQSDGTNPIQLTNLAVTHTGTPRWSPDGKHIAFDNSAEGQRDIYVVGTSGGKPRRLTSEASIEVRPSWSRDGKWIYFASDRTGNWQVWKAPAEGGQAVQVTKQGGREAFESPDSKFVYYTKGANLTSLWRIPTMGGEESQVLDQIFQGYWAVLEQGIYYLNVKATPRTLEFFSFATNRTTQLAVIEKRFPSATPGFAVSPDGRWILLAQTDQSESDIMLMENFR